MRNMVKKEVPHILQRLLKDSRQETDENMKDNEERVQKFAVDGYPNMSKKLPEILAIDALLRGCLDKRAVLVVIVMGKKS